MSAVEDSFLNGTNLIKSTRQDQKQQPRLRKQDFAASAKDPMKLTKHKGSKHTIEAGFCCL